MPNTFTLRPSAPADLDRCASICFDAFKAINVRHGYPPEFPEPQFMHGFLEMVLGSPIVDGVVAEANGQVIGSNFLWDFGFVAGVGPITVDTSTQARSVGRKLMEHVLRIAAEKKFPSVRLVQSAFNTQSMSLYTKLGFDVREPLVCLQGNMSRETIPGIKVRKATEADVEACCDVCRRVHGHERRVELMMSLSQGSAMVAERGSAVVGYTAGIGFFGHTVALDNPALMALIEAAEQISGPGLLLPSRDGEVFRWCLSRGLRMVQPMTLMSLGMYNEPRGAFLPSVLY